jgi:hypothetical protein
MASDGIPWNKARNASRLSTWVAGVFKTANRSWTASADNPVSSGPAR